MASLSKVLRASWLESVRAAIGTRAHLLISPEAAWLMVVLLVPLFFNPWGSNSFELPKAALVRALVLVALLGALIEIGQYTHSALIAFVRRFPLPVLWALLAWGLALVLATFSSVNPRASIWGNYDRQQGLLTIAAYPVLFLVVILFLRTPRQAMRLVDAIIWGSAPVVLYGLVQLLGRDPIHWTTDGNSPIVSTLGRSNFVGTYLVLVLPLTLAAWTRRVRRWPYLLLAFGQLACLATTGARGAWIGVSAGLLAMGLLRTAAPPRRRVLLILLCLCVAVAVFAIAFYLGTDTATSLGRVPVLGRLVSLGQTNGGATAARLTIWQTTLPLLVERPLVGYGPETMASAFARVFPPQLIYYEGRYASVDRAHNLWLDTGMSAGVLGLASFVALLVSIVVRLLKRLGECRQRQEIGLSAGLLASIVGHLVDLQFSFEVTATAVIFWLVLACAVAATSGLVSEGGDRLPPAGGIERLAFVPPAILVALLIAQLSVRPVLADMAFWKSQQASGPYDQREAADQAVQLWPYEPEYHIRLASIDLSIGLLNQMEEQLAIVEELSPNDPRAQTVGGDLYARSCPINAACLAQAERAYRNAIGLAPTVGAYHAALGWALAQQGRYEEGATELRRAVALDATDVESYRLLASLYLALGRKSGAVWAWQHTGRWLK